MEDTTEVEEVNGEVSNEGSSNVPTPVQTPERNRSEKRNAEVKRKYEDEKCCRKFCVSWKKAFQWVKLAEDRSKMFCEICSLYPSLCDKDSKFVKVGCSNFHIKSLRTHNKSEGHKKCVRHHNAKNSAPSTTAAAKIVQKMESQKMRILFRISHALAMKGSPFKDFRWFIELHETAHNVSLGETYRNSKQCHNFTSYIAETERLKLASELAQAPFYSVMTDGTTDSSISEAEIMYVR